MARLGTGRDLQEDWGDGTSKIFDVGDSLCIRTLNFSRSSVIGCVAKYELTKKSCHGGIFCSEIEAFVKKMVLLYIRFQTVEFSTLKWNFFSVKRSFKNLIRENFFSSPQ